MHKITTVKALEGFCLQLKFEGGPSGKVDLSDRLFGPVFELLWDAKVFAQVRVDEFGVTC